MSSEALAWRSPTARPEPADDIDARIDAGHGALTDAVREIATERNLPTGWLNEQATTAIPRTPDRRAQTLYESANLLVTGASAEHLLAMKLEASRPKDVGDIELLLSKLQITECDDALAIHKDVLPDSERRSQARALLNSLANESPGLAPPTSTHDERTWLTALARDDFPRYTFKETQKGLTLTVQETHDSPKQVIKEGLTQHGLARLECAHRGWPEQAVDTIKGFTAAELAKNRATT